MRTSLPTSRSAPRTDCAIRARSRSRSSRFRWAATPARTISSGSRTFITASRSQRAMNRRIFGEVDGRPVQEVTLRSDTGAEAKIIEWGAVIRDLTIPLGQGRMQRVVLGLNSLDDYIRHSPYFGAIAGRYGNRIVQGRFRLGGRVHQLSLNDGRNSLHGGNAGFSNRPWQLAD